MSWTCIYVPAETIEAAKRVAALIEAGNIRVQPHWRSREACDRFIDGLPAAGNADGIRYLATAISVRIPEGAQVYVPAPAVGWEFDSVGSIAAALLIVIGGPFLVGLATLVERLA